MKFRAQGSEFMIPSRTNFHRDTNMDDSQLIVRLKGFFHTRAADGFNVLDFLHAEGSPLVALMYARLFWPEFVEVDGMVLLKESVEDEADRARVMDAMQRKGGDRAFVEYSFNMREVEDIFGRRIGDSTDAEDLVLVEKLCAMWQCRLREVYPGLTFSVLVVPPESTGGSVGITFYQPR